MFQLLGRWEFPVCGPKNVPQHGNGSEIGTGREWECVAVLEISTPRGGKLLIKEKRGELGVENREDPTVRETWSYRTVESGVRKRGRLESEHWKNC